MYKLIAEKVNNDIPNITVMDDIALEFEYASLKDNLYIIGHYMPCDIEYNSDLFRAWYKAIYRELKALYDKFVMTNSYHYMRANTYYNADIDLYLEQ